MPDYGSDRLTRTILNCEECGRDHPELEFKRVTVVDPECPNATHRGRCPRTHKWLYLEHVMFN